MRKRRRKLESTPTTHALVTDGGDLITGAMREPDGSVLFPRHAGEPVTVIGAFLPDGRFVRFDPAPEDT